MVKSGVGGSRVGKIRFSVLLIYSSGCWALGRISNTQDHALLVIVL
jgi:hypothetical protein